MLRVGQWLLRIGIVFTVIGVVGGFGALLADFGKQSLSIIALAPIGVVLSFAGLAIVVLLEPRSGDGD